MAEIPSSIHVACAVSDLRKPGGLKWCADLRIRLHQRIFGQGVAFVRLTNDRYFPLAVFVGFWPFIPFFDGIKIGLLQLRQTDRGALISDPLSFLTTLRHPLFFPSFASFSPSLLSVSPTPFSP